MFDKTLDTMSDIYKKMYYNSEGEKRTISPKAKGAISYAAAASRGLTIGSAVGSYAGASLSAQSGGDPYDGAMIGGAVGGIAGIGISVGTTALVRNAGGIANSAMDGIFNLGSKIKTTLEDPLAMEALGKKMKGVGMKALDGAKAVGEVGFNAASIGIGAGVRAVNTAGFLGSILTTDKKYNFVKRNLLREAEPAKVENILGRRLNVVGKAVSGAVALGAGAVEGFKEHEKFHRGANDGQVRTATPTFSSMMDHAGATGDLVFALNANKRRY